MNVYQDLILEHLFWLTASNSTFLSSVQSIGQKRTQHKFMNDVLKMGMIMTILMPLSLLLIFLFLFIWFDNKLRVVSPWSTVIVLVLLKYTIKNRNFEETKHTEREYKMQK